jgi:hypothetical protein
MKLKQLVVLRYNPGDSDNLLKNFNIQSFNFIQSIKFTQVSMRKAAMRFRCSE